jgi:hypothetical protein
MIPLLPQAGLKFFSRKRRLFNDKAPLQLEEAL